jgi:hypothetical protein
MSDWINWNGWDRSIENDAAVEVEFRSGAKGSGIANDFFWNNVGGSSDIVRYRVLDEAKPKTNSIDSTLAERGKRYGTFVGHAEVSQGIKRFMAGKLLERNKTLTDDQWESLEMIAHKIARIINGDPDYADSWLDIAGYAKLVADRLEGVKG